MSYRLGVPGTVAPPTYHGPIAAGDPGVDASRRCQRPGCAATADATLTFAYGSRESWIAPLAGELAPQAYDLCGPHADRTEPPSGWDLRDRRPTAGDRSVAGGSRRSPDRPPDLSEGFADDRPDASLAAPRSRSGPQTPTRRRPPGPVLRTQPGSARTSHPEAGPAPSADEAAAAWPDPPIEVRARSW